MHWQGVKLPIVIISLALALVGFFGARWIYNSVNFQQPLAEQLDNNKQVISYNIENSVDNAYKITISLKRDTNLMQNYRPVYDEIKKIMGNRPFTVDLTDHRNELLNEVYQKGQFAVQEAIFNGNYTEMAESLERYASQVGVESEVSMDDINIYWQLRDGNNYLYSVVPMENYSERINANIASEGR